MSIVNLSKKEINVKIVYSGTGFAGRTTSVRYIYENIKVTDKGCLTCFATEKEQIMFVDFVSPLFPKLHGYGIRFHLYVASGSRFLESSHRKVLEGVDGIVFVADSIPLRLETNTIFFEMLKQHLSPMTLLEIPNVLQINKRDYSDAVSTDLLVQTLNYQGGQFVETIATRGIGVLETFVLIAKNTIYKIGLLGINSLPTIRE